jgi:glycosyltransferase involved in cell wall biosynthesis
VVVLRHYNSHTLNEEKYLPKLLDSINRQNLKNFEVIISDNFSKDNTRKIAARYHCRIVDGGLPSRARNNGAYESKGNLLLFLDADVILDDDFLNPCIKEFKKRQLDVASVMSISNEPFRSIFCLP